MGALVSRGLRPHALTGKKCTWYRYSTTQPICMNTAPDHHCRLIGTPWPGVFCTHIESGHHYGRHWHATYGMGFVEHGAQISASGRGNVEAYAGDIITTNPGEVHDGRPLGGPSRRWRIVYMERSVFTSMPGEHESTAGSDLEITRPVIKDARLRRALQRLFARLEDWSAGRCSGVLMGAVPPPQQVPA